MIILIAEDDPVTLEALAACMEADGFTTLRAANGREALELWTSDQPHLLCLDIMMPEIDGFEVCRQVRSQDQRVPILFLSAKNEERDIVAGLDLGADDFIRKPFTRREVMARIRAALRRASPHDDASAFQMSDLHVRPASLLAIRDEKEIDLTPREVTILQLLHRECGVAVPRDRFLDQCWGLDYFPDSRTLDQHILMLRKKVERNPGQPKIIETVRGVGYRFRDG